MIESNRMNQMADMRTPADRSRYALASTFSTIGSFLQHGFDLSDLLGLPEADGSHRWFPFSSQRLLLEEVHAINNGLADALGRHNKFEHHFETVQLY